MDCSGTNLSIHRNIFSYSKVQALVSWCIRGQRAFIRRKAASYLNIGCGSNIRSEFLNLDFAWRPGIDICWDLNLGIPLASGSINGCFSEHCIEHLGIEAAIQTFNEIHRVLKSGAWVRIVVPDAEMYIDEYVKHRRGEVTAIPYADVFAENTPMMSINRVFRNFEHKYAWDFETLKFFLENAGFVSIKKVSFLNGTHIALLIDSEGRRIESLYVEAMKP